MRSKGCLYFLNAKTLPNATHHCCMTHRRLLQAGPVMFITTNTEHRAPTFERPPYSREAIDTLYRTKLLHPFSLFGFVVMYDHCHLLMEVKAPQRISRIMNVWKGGTSHNIGVGRIWQARYHMIVPSNPHAMLQYIHENPVKAGYCNSPEEYPWSSANGAWPVSRLPSI